ncbi:MAG TPA: hypothetical protein VFP39_02690 [Gemmatimonadales bacterium]|nr:hypothetical protein [Gemmatimonadales bacterium]
MAKAPNKSTAAIQRLLEERRQYEAWIARIDAAGGAAPSSVRSRVRSDYEARLNAVTEELKVHAEAARLMAAQRREVRRDLQGKEMAAAERLAEAELRHAVGEYDESQWTQVHKESLAELVSVREELGAVEEDIAQLEELERLVKTKPVTAAPAPAPPPPPPPVSTPPAVAAGSNTGTMPRVGSPPRPQAPAPAAPPAKDGQKNDGKAAEKPAMIDELAFLKSVTDDDKRGIGSPGPAPTIRRSGAQFQPVEPAPTPSRPAPTPTPTSSQPSPSSVAATPSNNDDPEPVRTLKCRECGTMNLPTEWYCESCGAELAAL